MFHVENLKCGSDAETIDWNGVPTAFSIDAHVIRPISEARMAFALGDGTERRVVKFTDVELRRDGDEGPVKFSGYAAVFNSFSVDIGGFREIIRPGAFANSIRKSPDVRFLINHDGLPLARTPKTLTIYEDQRGLKVEANLDPNDPDVQRLKPKMDRGDVDQMSFAFRTVSDSWRTERGEQIRELHEVDIDGGDVSIVTYPAYPATEAALRSLEAWKQEAQRASQAQLEAEHKHRDRLLRLQERQ